MKFKKFKQNIEIKGYNKVIDTLNNSFKIISIYNSYNNLDMFSFLKNNQLKSIKKNI